MVRYSLPYAKFSGGGGIKRKINRKRKYIKRSKRNYNVSVRRSGKKSKHRVQKGGNIFSALLKGIGSVAKNLLDI